MPPTKNNARIDELFKNTEKQLDLLQAETRKRIDTLIADLLKGDIAGIRNEIRKGIEAGQRRQFENDLGTIERSLAGLGEPFGQNDLSRQLIQNLSLNQHALGLQQLIQRALRNM